MYAVQAMLSRIYVLGFAFCEGKCYTERRFKGGGAFFTLEFLCCLDFGLGYAKGVAVVDVELHFVENVGHDFV